MRKRNKEVYFGSVVKPEKENRLVLSDCNPLVNDKFKTLDAWKNSIGNIGENNSIVQYNNYLLNRLSYAECGNISTDPIINKAINTITNEIFSNGGVLKITDDRIEQEVKDNLLQQVNSYFIDNDIVKILREATIKALQFGGAYIYIHTTDIDLHQPLYINDDTANKERLLGFKVLEAWQVTPIKVNNVNPLNDNYMNPELLYVIGGASSGVHHTRLIPIVFFDIPFLIKPLFNYLGLSLTQLMKDYVSNADIIRQSLGDLFIRFRSFLIKTNAHNIGDAQYKARVKFIAENMNNNGILLLSNNEELQQLITPITGLDNIQSQAYELMVATSGIPATKLLGISPRGFNATGEHDLKNYYDNIKSYQSNIFKNIFESVYQIILCFKFNIHIKSLEYAFNPLGQSTDKEYAEIRNLNADYLVKLKQNDIISDDEALRALKNSDFDFSNINLDTSKDDFSFESENSDFNFDDEINSIINNIENGGKIK